MNIDDYYKSKGETSMVGHIRFHSTNIDQPTHLSEIVKSSNAKNIMEIGFNGGHSADLFLSLNNEIKLTSLDIGEVDAVLFGKSFIDTNYPFRHNLIVGDSKESVPAFSKLNPNTFFDVIFIDGGHEFIDSISDIVHCKKLAHKDTIVILDDTRFSPPMKNWNLGPNKAWETCVNKGYVKEICRYDYMDEKFPWKGQSWGKYNNV